MNIKKRILSFLLAIVMILTMVPALSVSAEEPVDLIHSSGNTLREGVFVTSNGGQYSDSLGLWRVVDNSMQHAWASKWSPGDYAWVQINLPEASQWTNVTVTATNTQNYNVAFKVLASNDPTFATSTLLAEKAGGYSTAAERNVEITDQALLSTPYRYLRVITTSSGKRFGVMEIDITGYEPTLPTTTGLTELTQKADVYAKVAETNANAYTAQQAIDGDRTTNYIVTDATTPELMVDLRREAELSMIEFTPATGDAAYRKDYEIHTSNSADFSSYDIVYKNTNAETEDGAVVRAYMPADKSARYVRIKADGSALGIAEFKIWGTESTYTLENMVSPATVSATSGANPEYTADNTVSTVWKNAEETGKSSITYDLEAAMTAQSKALPITTSIMLLPADGEESRKNFNIYGSMSGDFTDDAELIKAVGETPLSIGQYEIISLDEPKAYKKIKIEKATEPSSAESLGFNEVKIIHNSLDAVVKVESSSPANGTTGVTNMGDSATNLVEVLLNRNIVASSITPANVVIKDVTDGGDTVLTSWTPYEVSGKKLSIDVSSLDSNKTYEVTLTTNVETALGNLTEEYTFSFTTGLILKIPYDPDKVLVNIVTGKNITGNPYSASYPLERILDGNDSNFMITNGAPKIQLDLGNFYDIVAVQIVPRAGDPDNTIPNLNILASDTVFNFTATDIMDKAIAAYPATNVGTQTIVLSNAVNTRYLGIYRASGYLGLGEFRAYAYVDKDLLNIGAWNVNGSATTTEFAAAGTYTFSASVNNLSDSSTNLYMTVFAYDANGAMLEKANEVKAVASGSNTLSAEVTLDAADFAAASEITAVIYKAQGDAKMVVDAKTITKVGTTAQTPAQTPDSVKVEYKAKTANERVAMQVLGPKADGAGYDFDDDSIYPVTFNTELCYSKGSGMLAKDETIAFNFKVADPADYGEYSIRTTVTKANGTTTTQDSYLLYLSQAQIDGCIEDFIAFPQTLTMRQLIDKWTDNLNTGYKYINMVQLPASLATSVPTGFDAMFEYLCDLYVADGQMSEIADVVDLINAAYVMAMYYANDADAAKAALTSYTGDINGLYSRKDATTNEEIIDTARYATVFNSLKSNIQDAATLKTVMQWAAPLSLVQGGTREDVAYAIENYNDILGCDLSYAQANNVTVAQAVMKIATADASSYYNGFADVFKDAVDAVVEERGTPGTTTTAPSAIVSPGVGPMSTKPSTNDKVDEEPVTLPEDTEPEKEIPFSDIENIAWAKDYIADLYEKGIVSGDGDGSFYPERQVSREEFLKMLIEALDIDVASKEATEFDDCAPDAWYYPYVQIASTNKITKGISRKIFGIGQNITRQDMAVLLSKALAVKNVTAIESDFVFGDEDAISEYAQSDVSKMYSLGLISGFEDGTFAPKAYTTRAQAAVIIGRALEYLGGASK